MAAKIELISFFPHAFGYWKEANPCLLSAAEKKIIRIYILPLTDSFISCVWWLKKEANQL